jgi:hypothetical protein
LDTETKGTGAHVVPLEKAQEKPRERDLATFAFKRPPAAAKAPPAAAPLRFKVTDVLSARVLAEGVDARGAVDSLKQLRSVLDARIYVWVPKAARWRLLTLEEQKALWQFREDVAAS